MIVNSRDVLLSWELRVLHPWFHYVSPFNTYLEITTVILRSVIDKPHNTNLFFVLSDVVTHYQLLDSLLITYRKFSFSPPGAY